jgi:hypothetical protein
MVEDHGVLLLFNFIVQEPQHAWAAESGTMGREAVMCKR